MYSKRELSFKGCFYNRPVTLYNLQSKAPNYTWGRGGGVRQRQTINMWFIFISFWGRCILSKRERWRGGRKSNKDGDLYGGGSLLSHVIPQEPAGALRSYFHTVRRQPDRPSTSAQTMAPLPPFSAWPLCVQPCIHVLHSLTQGCICENSPANTA